MIRLVALFVCLAGLESAEAAGLPRATPESQGVVSTGVLDYVERADAEIDAMNSFMLVRHGRVVAEGWWSPYQREDRHQLYSLSKSFTSAAVGIAIAEGKLSLDDRVVDWFPDRLPVEPSDYLRAMRVRDLLRMTTGHLAPALGGFRWGESATVERFLSLPVALKPGTHFTYNTPATYVASAIVQEATGEKTHDYLRPRLLEPLGIEDSWWEATSEGVTMGGSGFHLRTEDLAKFGQLMLQRGEWDGEQLVPSEWVVAATSMQTPNGSDPTGDWDQGYGYQFWRSTHGYRGDGAFGQFCLVLPKQDAVVVITSGGLDLGAVMRLVWDHLLPAMHDKALPEDPAAQSRLRERLTGLQLAMPQGTAASSRSAAIGRSEYRVADDELGLQGLRLETTTQGVRLTIVNAAGPQRLELGYGEWRRGKVESVEGLAAMTNRLATPPEGRVAVAGSGAWVDDDTYQARVCLNETPFYHDVTLRFVDGEVTIRVTQNASFEPERTQPVRTGTRWSESPKISSGAVQTERAGLSP